MSAAVLSWLGHASLALIPAVVIAWWVSIMLHRREASRLANFAWVPLPLALIPMPIWPTPVAELPGLRVVHDVLSLASDEGAIQGAFATPSVLVALWILGAITLIVASLLQQRRFLRDLGPCTPVDLDPALRSDCGLPNWLPVVTSNHSGGPLLCGLLPPRLMLPEQFQISDDDGRLVLRHEAAHLRHGDPWINGLVLMLRALFWFHPLIHLAAARLRRDQELAADAHALEGMDGASRRRYGRMLVAHCCPTSASNGLALLPTRSQLKERVQMIVHVPESTRSPLLTRLLLLTAPVLTLATLSLLAPWPGPVQAEAAEQPVVAEVDSNPIAIVRVNPRYPRAAAEEGTTGSVTLEARVNPDGSLDQVQIVDAEPEGVFDAEAMIAFAQWRFKPATPGEPMKRVRQTIYFQMEE